MSEGYDERVQRLATPKECAIFERNAENRGRSDLAEQARHRWIELNASALSGETAGHNAVDDALWAGLSAQEYVLGRAATPTRQRFKRTGPTKTAERIVCQSEQGMSLAALAETGLLDYAWESIVARHPEAFSEKAVTRSRERLAAHESEAAPETVE